MKFIDSSDVICIANNFYSCNELSAHSNRDRSAFIQIWMMEPGRKPHLVWTGYPRDLETFMKTKFKAVLKYNYYITKNTFCRPARTESNIFTYNNIVIDIDDHESSSGMVAWEKDVLKTELLYAADGELLDVEIPPISAIVDTGRGLQVWYSFDGIAAKNKKAYRLVTEAIIDKVQQVCEKIHDEHPEFVMKVDVAASKNAAGLVRLPGTTNAKTKNVSEIVYFNEEMKNRKFFGQDGLSSVLSFSALFAPDSTIKAGKKKKNKVPVTKDGKPVPTCVVADALERLFELRNYSKVPATGIRDLLLYIYFNTIFQHRGPAIAMEKTIWLNSKFANPLSETELDNAVGHIPSKLSEVVCTDGTTSYVPGYILPYSYIIETLQITAAVVLNRCCFDCQQFQRNRFAVVPEMRRNLCNDRTVFGDLIASLVIYAGTKNRFTAYIDTGQVRNTILVYVVDYTAEIVAFLQQRSVVLVPDMNGISLVNLAIVEQLCVAQLAVDTSDTGGTNGRRAVTAVFKDSVPTFQSVSTKVPIVAVSGTVCTQITGGVIEQSTVFGDFYIEVFAVPVTCEALDGLPSRGIKAQLRQVEVFHQFVAIAQRIPVAAAVGESRQNLLCIYCIDTMDEVRHLLVGLVSGTDFTLLALRNPHQGVDAKLHLLRRSVVDLTTTYFNRQVTNLVHNKVA